MLTPEEKFLEIIDGYSIKYSKDHFPSIIGFYNKKNKKIFVCYRGVIDIRKHNFIFKPFERKYKMSKNETIDYFKKMILKHLGLKCSIYMMKFR